MDAGDKLTAADLKAAIASQGIEDPGEGDVVLIHTGRGRHWIADNATFNSGAPGIGMEAAIWLAERDIAVVGSDTGPVEVVQNPNPDSVFQAHQELITRNGIYIYENLATEVLARRSLKPTSVLLLVSGVPVAWGDCSLT